MLVIALVSKTVMPVRVPTGQVFSHMLGVFATDSFADQAVLSSSLHQMWAIKYGSTMRTDPSYTPSDVFETFPRPEPTDRLAEIGRTLDTERREIMLRRDLGLTKLYNLVNDPDIADSDDRHRADAGDSRRTRPGRHGRLRLGRRASLTTGSTPTGRCSGGPSRPAARVEILDRLLEENLRRAAAQGEAPPPAEDEDEGDDE